MSVLWSVYLAVTFISHTHCTLSPENEVPLRTTTWLNDGKNIPVHLSKGHTHRFHFTLRKKMPALMLTVSPCSGSVEWHLTAHTLKDKPAKNHYWSFKKSEPEVWWRKSTNEKTLHSYSGSAVDTYMGPALHPISIYTLQIKSTQDDTHAHVYLHEGPAPWGVFPELPFDPRVHLLGVGMSSVTLTWNPSPTVLKTLHTHTHTHPYKYCVTVNSKHNYRSLCAAQEEKRAMCACEEMESVCTVSDLLPNTLYYFDLFVIDRMNSTSAAYIGTVAHTHTESHTHKEPHIHSVTPLREGQVQWVTLSSGAGERQSFRFRPRGGQKKGLLTLLSCNNAHTHTLTVSVSAQGNELTSQDVGDQLVQMWLQGFSSYLIQLRLAASHTYTAESETLCLKMQASSAFHRREAPALPHTLHIKSFNTLRTCSSVTLAWMGTEERGLYCLYRRRADMQNGTVGNSLKRGRQRSETGADRGLWSGPRTEKGQDIMTCSEQKSKTGRNQVKPRKQRSDIDRCLTPDSRPPDQRVLCKYFQELDARRAVTTATVSGLEAETLYTFDIYLMRRWALPVKYHSKTVRTRRDC
ncbi:protein NDNF [Tachysurus vachellii]|uniref:protein NDNF n=1 Tax=Tachysurus vachellii TaxID=175792 RepID=UPI00296AFE11|nr:protein NDNF [Tachysurus vachellii]